SGSISTNTTAPARWPCSSPRCGETSLKRDEIRFRRRTAGGVLPPPLAGEGWGEGVSPIENPHEERTLTRAFRAPSPASGRGGPPSRRIDSTQAHHALDHRHMRRRRSRCRAIEARIVGDLDL